MIERKLNWEKRVPDKRKRKIELESKDFALFIVPSTKLQKNSFHSVSQIQVVIHWGTIQQSYISLVDSNG